MRLILMILKIKIFVFIGQIYNLYLHLKTNPSRINYNYTTILITL